MHIIEELLDVFCYSARIGKQEDEEDIRRELEEMRRKKCKKIKLK